MFFLFCFIFFVDVVILLMARLLTDNNFVILVVEERVCQLGPSPMWHQQDFPSQRQILGARYCNQ